MSIEEILQQQKELLVQAEEQRAEIRCSFDNDFDSADEVSASDWSNGRDAAYIEELISCRQLLVEALEMLNSADKKSIHRGSKALDQVIAAARSVRRARYEDIRKAQEVIDAVDKLIDICDDVRE